MGSGTPARYIRSAARPPHAGHMPTSMPGISSSVCPHPNPMLVQAQRAIRQLDDDSDDDDADSESPLES